jgi:hypothetical protein
MAEAAASAQKKQAVVLIHGIGEQRPMSTLWRFVDLVWLKSPPPPGAPPRKVYSEPDEISGVFELRRLSSNFNADGKRTDFFEFYWAHLMRDNDLGDVLGWLGNLATRRKAQVPPQLHKAWRILRMAALVAPFLFASMFGGALFTGVEGHLAVLGGLIGMAALAIGALILLDQLFFSPVLGDAARYLRPTPKNVGCRQEIRDRGLQLLEALHASDKYDRIVLVGHSLGGVIAYELVGLLWGRRNRDMGRDGPVQQSLRQAEAAGLELKGAANEVTRDKWGKAQDALLADLRGLDDQNGKPLWLISDLITLGSPIAHADTLIAEDRDDFDLLVTRRELATNPPLYETFADAAQRFSYCRTPGLADVSEASPRCPNNSAVFAAVRWTNIYFPMQGIMRGDLISGAASGLFGAGVTDIAARAPGKGGWFPHMDYFRLDDEGPWGNPDWADHRLALRAALRLEQTP